jgi:hypothetical protein
MGALSVQDRKAVVALPECVECGVCFSFDICPKKALSAGELEWPRILRAEFSAPCIIHKTGISGRGTEEMKTNDVTNRFKDGDVGICVELGRPGTGTTFRDIEKVAVALLKTEGVILEEQNPVAALMLDRTGKIREDILDEKILSGIVEVLVPLEKTREVLAALQRVESEVDTVFSVDCVTRVAADGSLPPIEIAREMGIWVSPNCKTNMGMGCVS